MAYLVDTVDIAAAFDQIVTRIALYTAPVPDQPAAESAAPESDAPEASTEVNVELFQRALDYVTANPQEHDQSIWARRTDNGIVGCLGYHTARLAGHTMDWKRNGHPSFGSRCWFCDSDHSNESVHVVTEGGRVHVFDVAQQALGLTARQANLLFHPTVTLAQQWKYATEYTNGAITVPDSVKENV
jgi:hypothetical protein